MAETCTLLRKEQVWQHFFDLRYQQRNKEDLRFQIPGTRVRASRKVKRAERGPLREVVSDKSLVMGWVKDL
jgi:hypothetical protein